MKFISLVELLLLLRISFQETCSCPRFSVDLSCDTGLRLPDDQSKCIVMYGSTVTLRCTLDQDKHNLVKSIKYSFHRLNVPTDDDLFETIEGCNNNNDETTCEIENVTSNEADNSLGKPFVCVAEVELKDGSSTALASSSLVLDALYTAAELEDQNIIGSTFTIQRGALSATEDFKCWNVGGNDKVFPKTNPPLKVIWHFRNDTDQEWHNVENGDFKNIQIVRNKPEGVYKLGQLIVTNFTEKNVGKFRCSLKYNYKTEYKISELDKYWRTLREKECVITTYTTELLGDAGDATINTDIASKPEVKLFYRDNEYMVLNPSFSGFDLTTSKITWFYGEKKIEADGNYYITENNGLILRARQNYTIVSRDKDKYKIEIVRDDGNKKRVEVAVTQVLPKNFSDDFINSRTCIYSYENTTDKGEVKWNETYMTTGFGGVEGAKQYFPKGTVTWTIADEDGKIVIPEPDPHGMQKDNNGARLVINEGGLDNDSKYKDPNRNHTCNYYQYGIHEIGNGLVRYKITETITGYYLPKRKNTKKCDINMDAVNVSHDCYLTVGDTKFNYIPDVAVSWTDGDVEKRKLGPLLMEPIHDNCSKIEYPEKVDIMKLFDLPENIKLYVTIYEGRQSKDFICYRVYQCECDVKKKNMTVKLNGVIVTKLNCSKKSYNLSITCDKGYTLKNGTKEKVNEDEVTMFKCEEGAVFNYTCEKDSSNIIMIVVIVIVVLVIIVILVLLCWKWTVVKGWCVKTDNKEGQSVTMHNMEQDAGPQVEQQKTEVVGKSKETDPNQWPSAHKKKRQLSPIQRNSVHPVAV